MASLAMTAQSIAFGGLNWAMDEAAAPVQAVDRLLPRIGPVGALAPRPGDRSPVPTTGAGVALEIRDLHFTYPRTERPIYTGLDLDVDRGSRWRSSAPTVPARPRSPSCCAGFYDPTGGHDPGRRRRPHPSSTRTRGATG